jgi:opacity protein-like surface antigen
MYSRLLLAFFAAGILLCPKGNAGEIELKSLKSVQEDPATKRKYGPYVGVFGGSNSTQTGDVTIGGLSYPMLDRNGAGVFGIELGKTWRSKKSPLSFSVEFEGSFLSTDLQGQADEPTLAALAGNGLATYQADMNAAFFMLNGAVSLDLWRYRARLGKVLAGLKPYIGAGIGGGQVWFRNQLYQSKDQFTGANLNTISAESPFAIDEFISSWQWFGGVEYCWNDKYGVFAEYREFHFGELEDVVDMSTKGYAIGIRYRY